MNTSRISTLDLLRGIVMVIMALDHVRDFFNLGQLFGPDPTDLATTTPLLFFMRWITHYCAPVFVFLAGTSAFLYGRTRTTAELSRFLWTRGLWLVIVEVTIVGFGWQFDPFFRLTFLAVFWAIGVSMLALSVLVRLPRKAILIIGLALVGLHNLLDHVPVGEQGGTALAFDLLHRVGFFPLWGEHVLVVQYPVLPWIGTMALGYCLGALYAPDVTSAHRKSTLLRLGMAVTVLFIGLRALNIYGDLVPWSDQPGHVKDLLSFLNVTKYPPSLLYLSMTLGPALLFLGWAEGRQLRWSAPLVVFGRVPFFYYMVHIYLIHTLSLFATVWQGFPWQDTVLSPDKFSNGALDDHGFSLPVVYAVWIGVVLVAYFPSRWYAAYRSAHKEKWWLSYF